MGAACNRVYALPRTDTRDTLPRSGVCRCCRDQRTTTSASWKPRQGTGGSGAPDGHHAQTESGSHLVIPRGASPAHVGCQ